MVPVRGPQLKVSFWVAPTVLHGPHLPRGSSQAPRAPWGRRRRGPTGCGRSQRERTPPIHGDRCPTASLSTAHTPPVRPHGNRRECLDLGFPRHRTVVRWECCLLCPVLRTGPSCPDRGPGNLPDPGHQNRSHRGLQTGTGRVLPPRAHPDVGEVPRRTRGRHTRRRRGSSSKASGRFDVGVATGGTSSAEGLEHDPIGPSSTVPRPIWRWVSTS